MVDTRQKRFKRAGPVVFACPWLAIRKDAIGTSSGPFDHYYVVERPDSVTIVPISDANRTILLVVGVSDRPDRIRQNRRNGAHGNCARNRVL
jgi:hypothetical protein